MIFLLPACGKQCTHQFEGEVIRSANCLQKGERKLTCSLCGETASEVITKTEHTFGGGVITEKATCSAPGVKTYTCTSCGATKTETIAKTGHSYNSGSVTKSATCTATGVKTYTCSVCGGTKTETVAALDHQFGSDNVCTRCGVTNSAGTSASDKAAAEKVRYFGEELLQHNDEGGYYTLYFTVSNKEGYFSFDKTALQIKGLPVQGTTINLPTLPTTVNTYIYGTTIDCTFSVTKVEYKIVNKSLYLYFSGEKTYERDGRNRNQGSELAWTLYNSNNRVVASGTLTIPALTVGKTFADLEANAWNCIEAGGSYRLEISSPK